MSPDEIAVLELIWSHYKENGDWPRRGVLWRQLRALGMDLDDFAAQHPWIRVEHSAVSVGLEAFLELSEVRDLLEPLPRFMRLLARRFAEQPDLEEPGAPKPEVKSSELFELWGDTLRAILATRIFTELGRVGVWVRGNFPSEFHFEPRLDVLRYEHVDTLEQFLELSRHPERGSVTGEPRGKHLELLQAVYASIRETGLWPDPVDFTLQHRGSLGYVPNLLVELSPTYINERNGRRGTRRIQLTARCLPYVAGASGCALAVSIVRALLDLMIDEDPAKEFSIEQIANKLGHPVERVHPVAMLLEDSHLGDVAAWNQGRSEWRIRIYEYTLWKYKDVQTWAQFVAISQEDAPRLPVPPGVVIGKKVPDPLRDVGVLAAMAVPGILRQPVVAPRARPARPKIFIGHGHSKTWLVLREFLRDKLQLDPVEFNSSPAAGRPTVEVLQTFLNECALAFLVMTAEDELADGKWNARANVIHEIGLFQGRLGFDKAIILLEEGCSEFSNIAGLGHVRFPRDRIEACFEEIRNIVKHRLSDVKDG